MKLKRISGGVAVAVATLSLSGAAIADHEATCAAGLQRMIIDTAYALACEESWGTLGYTVEESMGIPSWPGNNPLWQRQAGKLKTEAERDSAGCEVHAKLVTQLYAVRPDDGSPPPRNKRNSNITRGAANALDSLNLKFDTAVAALESFRDSVDASKPNTESTTFPAVPTNPPIVNPTQDQWEQFLKDWADSTIYQVQVCGHML